MQDSPACEGEEQGVHVTIAPGGVGVRGELRGGGLGEVDVGVKGAVDAVMNGEPRSPRAVESTLC